MAFYYFPSCKATAQFRTAAETGRTEDRKTGCTAFLYPDI